MGTIVSLPGSTMTTSPKKKLKAVRGRFHLVCSRVCRQIDILLVGYNQLLTK